MMVTIATILSHLPEYRLFGEEAWKLSQPGYQWALLEIACHDKALSHDR